MASWFRKKTYPIGIDLGRSGVKLLQLSEAGEDLSVLDAASAQAPVEIRDDMQALHQWRMDTIANMLKSGKFKGRKVVIGLPSSDLVIQHLRMDKMAENELKTALPFAIQEKIPFPVNESLIRHVVAGEVYEGDQLRQEVVVMAVPAFVMNQQMQLIKKLKLEIEAINIEASAIANSFGLDQMDINEATMVVDLGYHCSKVVITHGKEIAFCRSVKLGVENVCLSLMTLMGTEKAQAEQSYIDFSLGQGQEDVSSVKEAVEPISDILVNELRSCLRYHDMMFENAQVSKVVFVGGQARDKRFCQELARNLGLPAQIGDPLGKMKFNGNVPEGIDADGLNPQWAVVFGLSCTNAQKAVCAN